MERERWTRLDAAIRAGDDIGFIDLRPDNSGVDDPQARRLAVGRLQKLEGMGLATAAGPGQSMMGLKAEPVLRDLGMRGDIIKAMHRGIADYVIDADTASSPIIGRLVATGLHNELTGQAYAVIPDTDGSAHQVRLRGIETFVDAPSAGGIVEVRRFGGPDDPRPTLATPMRSPMVLRRVMRSPMKAAARTAISTGFSFVSASAVA